MNNFISMALYTPVGYFASMIVLLAFAASPLFRGADSSWHPESTRTTTIDGLRGFLALGVFFHHSMIYHRFLLTGVWNIPPSAFFTQLGQSSVILFFMITGFLFYGKAIKSSGKIRWLELYIGRIFRIGPMYLFVTAVMLAIVLLNTGFVLHGSLFGFLRELFRLSLLGYYTPSNVINGYSRPWVILAGVTWTLHYEWLFYLLLLPVSAFFARFRILHMPYAIAGLAVSLLLVNYHPDTNTVGIAAFFTGMSCVALSYREINIKANSRLDYLASVAVMLLLVLLAQQPVAYAFLPVVIISAIFFLVGSGCTLFGLMTLRASRRLGEISYSIYLSQGLVLYAFLQLPTFRTFALSSVFSYWITILIAGITLVSFALVTHLLIEKNGIRSGKNFSRALSEAKKKYSSFAKPANREL